MVPVKSDNARIAAVFEAVADLLEAQDENPFRIRMLHLICHGLRPKARDRRPTPY